MSHASSPVSHTSRFKAKLVLSATSLIVALFVAEGSVRLWDRFSGTAYSAWRTETAIREVVSAMTDATPSTDPPSGTEPTAPSGSGGNSSSGRKGRKTLRFRLHPYTGFDLDTGLVVTERTVAFFEKDDPDRPYVIFILGGSVASIFGGNVQGGAPRLIERLQADPAWEGRSIKIVRIGVPGFKQPQQLMQLAYLLSRGCDPDMVLNLDGLNELRIGVRNATRGLQPTWPSLGHWTQATSSTPRDEIALDLLLGMRALQREVQEAAHAALARHYCYSAILGKLTLSRLTRSRSQWVRAQKAFVERRVQLDRRERAHAFGVLAEEEGSLQATVRCWFESSLAMHQLCSARGIRYVHALQPTLHDEGSKTITEEEWRKGVGEKGFQTTVLEGYPLLREGMAELHDLGVEALDLSLAFQDVEETVYYDNCHFGTLGCRTLADRMADGMGVAPLERPLVADER